MRRSVRKGEETFEVGKRMMVVRWMLQRDDLLGWRAEVCRCDEDLLLWYVMF